jgi:hypothetical protein
MSFAKPLRARHLALVSAAVLAAIGITPRSDGQPAAAASAVSSDHPLPMRVGDSVFWDGGFVATGQVRNADMCGVTGPCFEFALDLKPAGSRLRVGIDTPSREDAFKVEVVNPAGTVATSATNSNMFNAEAFVATPAAGVWKVRVIPQDVQDATFRMRAKLEPATTTKPPAAKKAVLPNLQVVPAYEFGFTAPVTPNGSYPPDRANPPASALGYSVASCTPDETAPTDTGGAGAVDCLRLTSGPMNVGKGPFDMRFTFVDDMSTGTAQPAYLRGPIFQAVHYTDGSVEFRPAGAYIFHTTHGHFHDENILTYELFNVTNPTTGQLALAGSGTKSGFCPADQLFGDWFRFDQAVRGDFGEGDNPTGNCFSPADGLLGLTSGWGDVYRWQRPGQYVEFGGQGDGLYVVRATVDKANHILETVETDNSSYSLIKVTGRSIDLVERGQGLSPWDPKKAVFTGAGPSSRR